MNQRDSIKTIQRAVGAEPDGVMGPATLAAILREFARVGILAPTVIPDTDLDARTLKYLATLDAKAQEPMAHFMRLAKATAATFGCEYVVISGTRTWNEQAELKRKSDAGGPHAAPPGYSWHNFGTAIDCGVFLAGIYLDDGSSTQQALANKVHYAVAMHARDCGLEHGGTWKGKSCDPPHFQIDMGHSSPTSADRAKFKREGSVL
jgi:peptidoglycan LD-endopeptidase CwlK